MIVSKERPKKEAIYQIQLRVSDKMKTAIRDAANAEHRSINNQILIWIERGMATDAKRQKKIAAE